jgi:putative transposase
MTADEDDRRRSVRLRGFDYSQRGFFFVTICTHNKSSTLGKIVNFESRLSRLGKMVEDCWREIPKHFPNVHLDEWVIMPNHLHGIIVIRFPADKILVNEGTACRAPTSIRQSTSREPSFEEFGKPVKGSLPTIVRSFKGAASKKVREECGEKFLPLWQRGYFEHVIRNEDSFNRIRNYIWENPIHWESDEYHRM